MNQTIRTFALVAAGLLAAALFLFALSLALGMALLGVIALFAAWAASPEDTKAFLKTARGMVDGWVVAMVKKVEDAGGLMREVLSRWGRKAAAESTAAGTQAAPETAQPARASSQARIVEAEEAPAKEPKP